MVAVDSTRRAKFFRCIKNPPFRFRAWALPQQSIPAASAWRALPGALHLFEQILDPRRFAPSLPPPPPPIFQDLFSTKILYNSLCFCEFSPIFPRIYGHNAEACQESARFPGIPVMQVLFPQTVNFAETLKAPLPGPSGVLARQQPAKSHPFFLFPCLFYTRRSGPGIPKFSAPHT